MIEGTVTVPCFLQNAGCAVGAGFNRGADGMPLQKPGNTYAAFFRCVVPRTLPPGGRARAALRPRPARQPARLARLRAGAAQDARRPEGLHRLRHLLERALGRQRRRGHRPGRRRDPGPLEVRRDHRPAPAGDAQRPVRRARDGRRRRVPRAPGVRGRVRAERAAVLRRQLAGRDRGRRADGRGARLRPRGPRRAGHELLDAADPLGRLRAVPHACWRAPTAIRSSAR